MRVLLLLMLLFSYACQCSRPSAPSQAAGKALEEWLLRNCTEGERGDLEATLRKYAAELEPKLVEAFAEETPPELLRRVQSAAEGQYERLRSRIDEGTKAGLGPEQIAALRALTKEAFVAQERDSFIHGYRAAALEGLALIRTPHAMDYLRKVAADPKSPFREDAGDLLPR